MAYPDDVQPPPELEEAPRNRTDRILPQSVITEQQVLGAMMLSRQAISRVVAFVDESAFHAGRYGGRHRQIFNAIANLYERGEPVDLPVLTRELERRGILEECGGPAYLADIAASVGTSANVEYHARQLLQLTIRRKTIALANQLSADSYDTSNDIYERLETFEHGLFNLAEHRWKEGFVHIEPIMHRAYERIETVSRYQGEVTGVPSGFEHLDRLTAGFQRGEFSVVAGRPGMGKTAFVLNVALRAAVAHRQPVGIFSLEMSGELVAQRLLCTEAHVDGQLVRTGRLNDAMWNRLSKAVATLTDAPIFIDDSPNLSPLEVRAKGRRLVHEHSAQLIILDYLQLMRLPYRIENRAQEVGEISQSLKALAKDLDIPIIACSQVTREVEKRGDTRPKLSDLRESGSIEQDADVVMFVHRPEYYRILQDEQGRDLTGVAEILIEKQRNGPTGKVLLRWFNQYGLFEPLAPEEMEPSPEAPKAPPEEVPAEESPF